VGGAAVSDDQTAARLAEARLLLELPGFHKLRALAMKWDATYIHEECPICRARPLEPCRDPITQRGLTRMHPERRKQ